MTTLYLKQKVFTFLDKFTAKDEAENDKYFVQGHLAFGKELEVFDSSGQSVAYIRQRLLSFLPRFEIEINGKYVCTINRDLTFWGQSYSIDDLDWHVKGDFLAHEYGLYDHTNNPIMEMRRVFFTWGDTYALNIHDPEQELICFCITLAIDACIAVRRR